MVNRSIDAAIKAMMTVGLILAGILLLHDVSQGKTAMNNDKALAVSPATKPVVVTYSPVTLTSLRATGHENGNRENEDARFARAATLFTPGSVEYLGAIPPPARIALAKGETVSMEGEEMSQAKTGVAKCLMCSGVHGMLKKPSLTALITMYRFVKTKQVFTLSDTCRVKYLNAHTTLSNLPRYRADFPKAIAR